MLLENGAKTDYRDNISDGVLYPATTLSEEPLHLAIKNQHYTAARILLGEYMPVLHEFFWQEVFELKVV